jgi:hypothetical protein
VWNAPPSVRIGHAAAIPFILASGKMRLIAGEVNMGVIENMKDVADLVKQFGDIELNRRILTLENEVLDLSRDKRRADEKVEELQRVISIKNDLTFRGNEYYLKTTDGEDGPFCSLCWDRDQKLIRLHSGRIEPCPACYQDRATAKRRR